MREVLRIASAEQSHMYSVGIRTALDKVRALDAVCRVVEQAGFLGKHPPLLTVVLLHTPSYAAALVTKPRQAAHMLRLRS